MIIVLQSLPDILATLKDRVQEEIGAERTAEMFFTSSHRAALDRVLAERGKSGRTIVISSAKFYGDYPGDIATSVLTGTVLATGVKGIDPTAWFFIYSIESQRNQHVDGIIPKDSEDMFVRAVEFLGLDFGQIKSLEELRQRLPWLE